MRVLRGEAWREPANFLPSWGCLFWFPQPVKTDQRVGSAWSPSLPPWVFKTHFLTQADLSAHSGLALRSISPLRYYKLLLKHPAWLYKLFVDKISVVKTTKTLCGGKIYKYHLDNQKISHHPGAMTMTPHIVTYSQYWLELRYRLTLLTIVDDSFCNVIHSMSRCDPRNFWSQHY